MKRINHSMKQNGAALVVGLILLVVITVLAISGMNTATTELAIARNDQNYENAFQAAETGLEIALASGPFTTSVMNLGAFAVNAPDIASAHDTVSVQIQFDSTTLVPDKAFSLGVGSGIAAYHFVATATAESNRVAGGGSDTDRDASAVHTQAFYVVGPSGSSL
jgi:type IV pilus assembly protein PilX